MGVLAILFASLSPCFLGLCLGVAFGERSRLTLAGAFERVEALLQIGDTTLEGIDDAIPF
jgi:hypothetical protein